MTIFNVISLFGGLALFLYGMRIMGDGLKKGSSGALKKAMEKVTNNSFMSFLLGFVVTAVIQSSKASIVLVSGLVGAGILTLHQSIGIILGANVGTTVTGQIIRLLDVNAGATSWLNIFKPSTLAPLAAIIGILIIMKFHFRNAETIGNIAMGFGILFTGLLSMTAAVEPLSSSPQFAQFFVSLSANPILGFLAGAVVAFLIQSSSASIGILQALSMTGALTFSSVYFFIIGVNLGESVTTAIVCGIGSKADAKRTGTVHVIFNIASAVLVIVGVAILHRLGVLDSIWNKTITSGGIANVHTLFRLIAAVVLLPVCGKMEKLSCKIVKDDPQIGESVDQEIRQLDEKFFNSPALALSSAKQAINTMARLSNNAVNNAMNVLHTYDQGTVELVTNNEDHIDTLADHVDNYLIQLSSHVPSGHDNNLWNYFIQCFSEFERIGDYAVNLVENAQSLKDRGMEFSETARAELTVLRDALDEIMGYACKAFSDMDEEAARHIEPIEEVVDDLVEALRANHIQRLRNGQCTVYAGLTFLDILVNVERISDQCSNLGVYTLCNTDHNVMMNQHDYIRWLHQGGDPSFNSEYAAAREKYLGRLNSIEE